MESIEYSISQQNPKEEYLNYLTHLIGLILSLIGTVTLLWISLSGDVYGTIGCSIYCATLIALYMASTCYHCELLVPHKRVLKRLDHICIYLFIAGSYTPLALGPLRHLHGWELLAMIWAIAIFGVIFKIMEIERFQILSLASYLLMGWLAVFSFPILQEELSSNAFLFLIMGGLAYTLGTIFYAWKTLPFNHTIWHLFVLAGSFCHYFLILDFI